jgi:enamine deaminase RidA (YjgF/YER057c/UK114 family)
MSAEARIEALGLRLPDAPAPLAAYVATARSGNLLYVSGQGPMDGAKVLIKGKVGRDVSEEQGAEAARLAAINALAVIRQAIGDLDKVTRVVKLNGYVNCTDSFERQHVVMNGASDLLVAVFGEKGRHARAAVGTNALPMGIPVELELVVEVAG